jgi:hypothetical protein
MSVEAIFERDKTHELFSSFFEGGPLAFLQSIFIKVVVWSKDIVKTFAGEINGREVMSKRKSGMENIIPNFSGNEDQKPTKSKIHLRENFDDINILESLSNIGNFGNNTKTGSQSTNIFQSSDELIGGYPLGATSSINNKINR